MRAFNTHQPLLLNVRSNYLEFNGESLDGSNRSSFIITVTSAFRSVAFFLQKSDVHKTYDSVFFSVAN